MYGSGTLASDPSTKLPKLKSAYVFLTDFTSALNTILELKRAERTECLSQDHIQSPKARMVRNTGTDFLECSNAQGGVVSKALELEDRQSIRRRDAQVEWVDGVVDTAENEGDIQLVGAWVCPDAGARVLCDK